MNEKIFNHFLELLQTDSSRAIADIICDEVGDNQEYFDIIYNFCFSHPYPVSMRAARVLPFCCEKYPELIYPYVDVLVERLMEATIDGVRRGLMKIMAESIDPSELNNSGLLVDKCVSWVLSQNEKPATRYYAIDILLRVTRKEPSLKNEVISILEILLNDQSAAIKSKAKKALRLI
jgi:hypothetical protein